MERSGKSKEVAIEAALKDLGLTRAEVTVEVLDEGSRGFLGLGARDARVRVTPINAPKAEAKPRAEVKTAPKQEVKKEVKAEVKKEVKKEAKKAVKKETDLTPEAEATKFLTDIFNAMQLDVNVEAKMGEERSMTIDLSGDNMGIVIGKRGDTLDSLQYLTSLVVNQCSEDYIKVSIDTENYREKRSDALLALSSRLAEKVARTGKKFTLEPMNPYERRIIHSNLQEHEAVTTYSIGQEPYRKVVIAPKNAKPYKKRNNQRPRKSNNTSTPVAEKTGSSYTTTYKADFKPQQHKAEYKNFEDYLAAQNNED